MIYHLTFEIVKFFNFKLESKFFPNNTNNLEFFFRKKEELIKLDMSCTKRSSPKCKSTTFGQRRKSKILIKNRKFLLKINHNL